MRVSTCFIPGKLRDSWRECDEELFPIVIEETFNCDAVVMEIIVLLLVLLKLAFAGARFYYRAVRGIRGAQRKLCPIEEINVHLDVVADGEGPFDAS